MKHWILILMAATWIYVDRPVASLQCDIITTGQVTLAPEVQNKQLSSAPITGGIRVIIFGLNQSVFTGKILISTASVTEIKTVKGANPDGTDSGCQVRNVSAPARVRAIPRP